MMRSRSRTRSRRTVKGAVILISFILDQLESVVAGTAGNREGRRKRRNVLLTRISDSAHTDNKMQLSGNKNRSRTASRAWWTCAAATQRLWTDRSAGRRRAPSDGTRFSSRRARGGRAERAGRRSAGVSGGWIGDRGAARNRAAPQDPPSRDAGFRGRHERVRELRRLRPGGGCPASQRRG